MCLCAGLPVHWRPPPTELSVADRYLFHVGPGGVGGGVGEGVGSSQTLPLNVLRNLSSRDHRSAAAAAAAEAAAAATHCIAWPRKTDKIYTCDDDHALLLRSASLAAAAAAAEAKGLPYSSSYARESACVRRDSSKRSYPGQAFGGVVGAVEKDRWTAAAVRNPSSGSSGGGGHFPPSSRCSGMVVTGGGSMNAEFPVGECVWDERAFHRKPMGGASQSGTSGGGGGGLGGLYRSGWQQQSPLHHQKQQQQLIVNEDGRLVVTGAGGCDASSQALPDTKV